MDIMEAMRARHSVRRYTDRPIDEAARAALQREIDAANREGDLRIQLVTDEPDAFSGAMARYGSFAGVRNYIALVGRRAADLDERLGYYGERVAIAAQMLGLNTCWVALTFRKGAARRAIRIERGERLRCVLSLGYGQTQGVPHKNRPLSEVCGVPDAQPDWFQAGMAAAMLAPTATNQQRFRITLDGDKAVFRATGGFYSQMDLGIVKYHFAIGSGRPTLQPQ